jgi:uncharacterized damage-inducible protein DinB
MATQAQRLAARFLSHRRALIDLARRLPEPAAGFRPWEGAMSTLEMLFHVAGSAEFFLSAALKRAPQSPPKGETIAGAIQALEELAEVEAAQIGALTDEQMEERITVQALNVTLAAANLISSMVDHEVHHKGQLFVYARMQGVEPPFFVDRQR